MTKKTSIFLILALVTGGGLAIASVSAQDVAEEAPRGDRVERKLRRMQRRLDLTDEQVTLIRPVLEEARTNRRSLRDLPREERPEAARGLRDRVHDRLEDILTPDQLDTLESMRRHRGFGRHGPPDPNRMVERMREHLELSDAQASRILPILEEAAEQRRALRDMEPEERREAAHALRTETMDAVRNELTEAQRAEFDAHREARRERRGRRGRHSRRHR